MEKTIKTKQLFANYLRTLYTEPSKEELKWAQEKCKTLTSLSWCAVFPNLRLARCLLSYYLILLKCPDYAYKNTVELVETRFNNEGGIQELIEHRGVVIITHSSMSIRNKLMLETLLHIISERIYCERTTIVVSNVVKDEGEYLYYDHNKIMQLIPCDISGSAKNIDSAGVSPILHKPVKSFIPTYTKIEGKNSSRPLANIVKSKSLAAEKQLKNRAAMIEESTQDAI